MLKTSSAFDFIELDCCLQDKNSFFSPVWQLIEKFVKFDDIFEAIESGNDNGLEAMIKQIIEDYEEEDEEE